jgi:DNA-binding NarL/FixJ family response regulator
MPQRDFLLMIGNDDVARAITEPLQRYATARRLRTHREVLSELAPGTHWSGLVFDLDGFDADPFATMDQLRTTHPLLPVLAIATRATPQLVNTLHLHRAELIVRPFGSESVVSFVQRALVSGWLPDERVAAWTEELARRRDLTPREVQLLAFTLGNESRRNVIRRLGITENTLKTQVRGLLRKCNARTMDSLAKTVLRDALVFPLQDTDDDDFMDELAAAPEASEGARVVAG